MQFVQLLNGGAKLTQAHQIAISSPTYRNFHPFGQSAVAFAQSALLFVRLQSNAMEDAATYESNQRGNQIAIRKLRFLTSSGHEDELISNFSTTWLIACGCKWNYQINYANDKIDRIFRWIARHYCCETGHFYSNAFRFIPMIAAMTTPFAKTLSQSNKLLGNNRNPILMWKFGKIAWPNVKNTNWNWFITKLKCNWIRCVCSGTINWKSIYLPIDFFCLTDYSNWISWNMGIKSVFCLNNWWQ